MLCDFSKHRTFTALFRLFSNLPAFERYNYHKILILEFQIVGGYIPTVWEGGRRITR